MPILTMGLGAALVILGVVGFVLTGAAHYTALIPAAAGAIFEVLGIVAMRPSARKHAMHAAAALAVLGFIATVSGVAPAARYLAGATVERAPAAVSKAIMSILCLVFVILCVRSFVVARRSRSAG
ncbi:MAG: hypothetical protein ACREJC_07025 [Tepidisphaeraceae bacterium]